MPDTKSVGEGGIDFARLDGDGDLFVARGLFGSAKPVKLFRDAYQHEPNVGDDRKQHFPQRLGLFGRERLARLPALRQREPSQLDQFDNNSR